MIYRVDSHLSIALNKPKSNFWRLTRRYYIFIFTTMWNEAELNTKSIGLNETLSYTYITMELFFILRVYLSTYSINLSKEGKK